MTMQARPNTPANGGADPTLTLDVSAITAESRKLASAITPKSGPWDVIVVGSGAAMPPASRCCCSKPAG